MLHIVLIFSAKIQQYFERLRYWAKIYNKLSSFARYRAFSLYIGSIQYSIRGKGTGTQITE